MTPGKVAAYAATSSTLTREAMLIPQWQMKNPIRSDMSFPLRKPHIDFSGYGRCIRQINRLQKQFRYVLDFYLVSDTQSCDGLIERSNAVRARRGDHPRTGVDGLFDPNISKTFFSITSLPWPAAAAA